MITVKLTPKIIMVMSLMQLITTLLIKTIKTNRNNNLKKERNKLL